MMGLAQLGANRPDIFNIDRRIAHRDAHTSTDQHNLLDFRNENATKGTIGTVLELLVSPNLNAEDLATIRSWDEKVDIALAMGIFVPEVLKTMNDQVKSLTGGKLDIYEADAMMHKLLGK